jgi:hypothetical protein
LIETPNSALGNGLMARVRGRDWGQLKRRAAAGYALTEAAVLMLATDRRSQFSFRPSSTPRQLHPETGPEEPSRCDGFCETLGLGSLADSANGPGKRA